MDRGGEVLAEHYYVLESAAPGPIGGPAIVTVEGHEALLGVLARVRPGALSQPPLILRAKTIREFIHASGYGRTTIN